MSLPWLQDDFKEPSKSRSRSPLGKNEADVNKPGLPSLQKTPRKSRSKSPSYRKSKDRSPGGRKTSRRSHDSSHSRKHRERKYRRSGKNRRSSSSSSRSSSSRSSSSSSGSVPTRVIVSKKSKYVNARLFVANIVSKDISKDELVRHFKKYGEILDALVHVKNYAFIQYGKEEHARLAIQGEHGKTFRGCQLVVFLASERQRQLDIEKEKRGSSQDRGEPASGQRGRRQGRGSRGRRDGPVDGPERRRSPPHGGPFPPPHGGPFPPPQHGGPFPPPHPGGAFPPPHHGGPFPPQFGGPGPEIFPGRRPRPSFGAGPGDFRGGDPFFEDPFRFGPPEPWMEGDPFRPNAFEEPFRDHRRSLMPAECEIFIMNPTLRPYGEFVEVQIKAVSIVTSVSVKPSHKRAIQLLEELRAQRALFAIFINGQNEVHKSLTLNILHGSPQEHRNMPLDDAVRFIHDSFRKYVEDLKIKSHSVSRAPAPVKLPDTFLPATPEVVYLLNLLADNRNLSVEELNTIIQYLTARRDKLIDPQSRSVEGTYRGSSKSDRRTPESLRRSPESHRRSPEGRRRSSEGRHRSPEDRHRIREESYSRSPNENVRRSPEENVRRSPEDGYRRSPKRHRRSASLTLDEVSQSPKIEATAAAKMPASLAEDLRSKIINILNSVRNAQAVPPAVEAPQQPKFPTGTSAATATQVQVGPLPPPQPLPPIPTEFTNFRNAGEQGSGNSKIQNTTEMLNNIKQTFLGHLGHTNTNNIMSAASQQLVAPGVPPSFEPMGENTYEQNTDDHTNWRMAPQDGYGFVDETRPGTWPESQGSAGMPFQGAYNYPGRHNQMGQMGDQMGNQMGQMGNQMGQMGNQMGQRGNQMGQMGNQMEQMGNSYGLPRY